MGVVVFFSSSNSLASSSPSINRNRSHFPPTQAVCYHGGSPSVVLRRPPGGLPMNPNRKTYKKCLFLKYDLQSIFEYI